MVRAAHLRGVLRGADHGRADALVRALEPRAPALDARADFLRQQHAEIAERRRLAAVDVFGHAAGKGDLLDRAAIGERVEPQRVPSRRAFGEPPRMALEQPIRHACGERARRLGRKRRCRGRA